MIVLLFVFPSPKRSIRAVILNNSMNFLCLHFLKAVANIRCFLVLTTPHEKKIKLFLFDVVHSFFCGLQIYNPFNSTYYTTGIIF